MFTRFIACFHAKKRAFTIGNNCYPIGASLSRTRYEAHYEACEHAPKHDLRSMLLHVNQDNF